MKTFIASIIHLGSKIMYMLSWPSSKCKQYPISCRNLMKILSSSSCNGDFSSLLIRSTSSYKIIFFPFARSSSSFRCKSLHVWGTVSPKLGYNTPYSSRAVRIFPNVSPSSSFALTKNSSRTINCFDSIIPLNSLHILSLMKIPLSWSLKHMHIVSQREKSGSSIIIVFANQTIFAVFISVCMVWHSREKGRDLNQSHDKSPYTLRKIKKQRDNIKNVTKNFDNTTSADRLRTVALFKLWIESDLKWCFYLGRIFFVQFF